MPFTPSEEQEFVYFLLELPLEFSTLAVIINASLQKLVSNLAKEGDGKFHVLKSYIKESKVPLLLTKGM